MVGKEVENRKKGGMMKYGGNKGVKMMRGIG